MSKNQQNDVPEAFATPAEEIEANKAKIREKMDKMVEKTIPVQQSSDDVDVTVDDTDGEVEENQTCEDCETKSRRFVKVTSFAKQHKKRIAIGALAVTAAGIALKIFFSGVPEQESTEEIVHTPEVDGSVDDN
jgi:hypothetical protein